jgi:cell division protein FtsB
MQKKTDSNFEKDNAILLSQFEYIIGKIEQLKADNKSLKQKIIGLDFQKENLSNEINNLKKNNAILKAENKQLQENLEKEHRIIPQNFKIRNKMIKIVSDIEDKDINAINFKEILEALIQEVEYCIRDLEK